MNYPMTVSVLVAVLVLIFFLGITWAMSPMHFLCPNYRTYLASPHDSFVNLVDPSSFSEDEALWEWPFAESNARTLVLLLLLALYVTGCICYLMKKRRAN